MSSMLDVGRVVSGSVRASRRCTAWLRPMLGLMPVWRAFRRLVVLAQQVAAEVAVEVAPYGMNVIAAVLRRVVFDQEQRALHAVVVLATALSPSGPAEAHVLDPAFAHPRYPGLGKSGL